MNPLHLQEPAALHRDAQVLGQLAHQGILLQSHKDHVIFERREILTQNGRPFGVFTPYKNAWLKAVQPSHLKPYPCQAEAGALAPRTLPALPELGLFAGLPSLPEIGFAPEASKQLKLPAGASGASTACPKTAWCFAA